MYSLSDFIENVHRESLEKEIFSAEQCKVLRWLERQTHTRTNSAQMLVGADEGAFLKLFVKRFYQMFQPNERFSLLEIGTFTGYSLLCFAFALKELSAENSQQELNSTFGIDAIEINDELEYLINESLARGGVEGFANVIFADAVEYLSVFNSKNYDIVFIDANKRNYLDYYKLVFPLVNQNGVILADNVKWYNRIGEHKDAKTEGVAIFNEFVAEQTENHLVESYLLPLRDGLYVIRKL